LCPLDFDRGNHARHRAAITAPSRRTGSMRALALTGEETMSVSVRQTSDRPQAAAYSATPTFATPAWQIAMALLIAGCALALWPLASPQKRVSLADPVAIAAKCADWDRSAEAAIAARLSSPEVVGKQVYARTASMWLAEARRSCTAGSDIRAERFYTRIISGPAR
jgi:hypothetical protein